MEGNVFGVNHLDSDVLLPPRKRLLACLKKQNSDMNVSQNPNLILSSPSECNSLDLIDTRIGYLLKPHLSNNNPSQEEIVEASRTAAEVAAKVAMVARAAAQEKAVIAARAMAAAKKALELVGNGDDGVEMRSFAEQLKKNKAKKQVDVQMLYDNDNNKPGFEINNINTNNHKTNDEELARKLHQTINSSPRISKSGASDVKKHKHKKLKTLEDGRVSNAKEVENVTKSNVGNGSKVKAGDDDVTISRKRGRMKQKKLPLSICHDKDQANPKEDVSKSPSSLGPAASERGPLWKFQAFKAHACVKRNKVMQL
ncbi:uncharacterized protein LOC143547127 [Bidens hawaiensis]|uniref:uncharacterized protein LOC143547127 n=1 Tax=Bidens hawaiensis TaxID=980011 RepID=UPI004048EE06